MIPMKHYASFVKLIQQRLLLDACGVRGDQTCGQRHITQPGWKQRITRCVSPQGQNAETSSRGRSRQVTREGRRHTLRHAGKVL
jgi:hypothetical protein